MEERGAGFKKCMWVPCGYVHIFKSLLYYTDKTITQWGGKIYVNGWDHLTFKFQSPFWF